MAKKTSKPKPKQPKKKNKSKTETPTSTSKLLAGFTDEEIEAEYNYRQARKQFVKAIGKGEWTDVLHLE